MVVELWVVEVQNGGVEAVVLRYLAAGITRLNDVGIRTVFACIPKAKLSANLEVATFRVDGWRPDRQQLICRGIVSSANTVAGIACFNSVLSVAGGSVCDGGKENGGDGKLGEHDRLREGNVMGLNERRGFSNIHYKGGWW